MKMLLHGTYAFVCYATYTPPKNVTSAFFVMRPTPKKKSGCDLRIRKYAICAFEKNMRITFFCYATYIQKKSARHLLSHALKRWGIPRPQGLCSRSTPLWATADFLPHSKALGTP